MKTNSSIDLSYLEETFGGNRYIITAILQSFIKNTPQLTEKLIDCVASNSWENAKAIAHTIKSSFMTVGAKKTGEVISKILAETSDENKRVVEPLIKKLAASSEQVFIEVNSTIDNYGE